MKKLRTLSASIIALMLLSISLTACGGKTAANSASQPVQEETASSVSEIAEATTPEEVEAPENMPEETVEGTVVGASMNNVIITETDGTTVMFPTVDATVTTNDGLQEGDWVTVTYKGTITADMAAVEVISVEENSQAAQDAANATEFKDAAAETKMYTTGPINVRSGYSTSYRVVATLPKGTEVEVLGEAENGWKKIKYNGSQYYMFGEYLTDKAPANTLDDATDGTVQATSGTVYTTVNLRVRDEPAVAGNVLGVAKKGAALIKTGFVGDWTQVEYDGGVGYCDTEYLKTAPTSDTVVTVSEGLPAGVEKTNADETMYTTFALHMRATCSTDATIIGTALKGSAIHVTGKLNNGWYEVQYSGRTAYCVAQFLTDKKPTTDNASAAMTAKDDTVWSITKLHIRENPSLGGVIITTVKSGTELTRTGISEDGKWSEIKYNDQTAYVATQYVTTNSNIESGSPTVQTVSQTKTATANLRMHASASLDSQVLGVVQKGTYIKRVGILSNGWSQVEYNGAQAYCASEYLA